MGAWVEMKLRALVDGWADIVKPLWTIAKVVGIVVLIACGGLLGGIGVVWLAEQLDSEVEA